jgi:DNA-binding NarL/FixJ family response regulator
MGDRTLKLLLIDPDPIFRLGLRVVLDTKDTERYLEVIADVSTDTAALRILADSTANNIQSINLIILELGNNSQQLGLQLCQQLKILYPQLPILLLTFVTQPEILSAAKAIGVNGYCPKGTPIAELINAMQTVVAGNSYWLTTDLQTLNKSAPQLFPKDLQPSIFMRLTNNFRLSGIEQINHNLAAVEAQLQIPGLPLLDKAVLAGQRRELLAARWLLNRMLSFPQTKPPIPASNQLPVSIPEASSIISQDNSKFAEDLPPVLSARALQARLFSACINKLQFSLENITDEPLEIDILREDKKRELLYNILQKITQQLDELRAAQIGNQQLSNLKDKLLLDLWQMGITDFFGKFSRLLVNDQEIEIVDLLLNNTKRIETEILQKIPLIPELFSYLLFQTDLHIDNMIYPADSEEANSQATMILENLLIQIANGVIQPLLNSLADVEKIKQIFYDRRLISTREIEKFRNNLSWKYRLNTYIKEAIAIFESRYDLLIFAPRGIAKISIYAPRGQELAQLSSIPLAVTLILEFRDAIAPRIKSILSLFGNAIVFILTQIVGRGLGLVGRGILQGIGSVSLTEKNVRRQSEKPK